MSAEPDSEDVSSEPESGGRWGRTPYRPEDLREQYGTTDSGRLDVTCPGCGRKFYPVDSCCIKGGSRTASPFCPNCGVDFRADEESVEANQIVNARARTDDAAEKLRAFIKETAGISMVDEKTVHREREGSK